MPDTQRLSCAAVFNFAVLCVGIVAAHASSAHVPERNHRKAPAKQDLLADFAGLAQNHPRPCSDDEAPAASPANWRIDRTECAWQERLRVRRWSAPAGMVPGDCVSPQARWWAWARGAKPLVWRTTWNARSLETDSGPEKRIVLIQRAAAGEWRATEWRWRPPQQVDTRRWEKARWDLLAALADRVNQAAAPAPLAVESALLQSVWSDNLGARAGEMTGALLRWQRDGLCLRSDPVAPGPPQFHLPYSVDDTRLEQRAAMQLQLARRYPKAFWLAPFRLVASPAQTRGGAQFYAVWIENSQVKGQLWMPAKGDGPVMRLRIVANVPDMSAAAIARAGQVVEHELASLASRWAGAHD